MCQIYKVKINFLKYRSFQLSTDLVKVNLVTIEKKIDSLIHDETIYSCDQSVDTKKKIT